MGQTIALVVEARVSGLLAGWSLEELLRKSTLQRDVERVLAAYLSDPATSEVIR